MDEEEFGEFDDDANEPDWRGLNPNERKELMKNLFTNADWYEEGAVPVVEGGNANPEFAAIAARVGAPEREIKRYYSAWLNQKGFSPKEALLGSSASESGPSGMEAFIRAENQQTSQPSNMTQMAMGNDMPPQLPAPPSGQNNESAGMWAMMNFLTQQQHMQMKQQQFQMLQMMDQRKLDQTREEGQRREAMARDQQFMNQQMAFMREMVKKSGDDGFFDSDMKQIMKERVVDQMLGGGSDDWKGMVKDVLGSDTLKAAVGGIGTAIGSRSATPAGYNVAGYDPYAQPEIQQQVAYQPDISQQVAYQPVQGNPNVIQAAEPQTVPEQHLDGVFFDDDTPQQAAPDIPREPSSAEYQQALLEAMAQMLGPAVNDPATMTALKAQIEVAVETAIVELPGRLPQHKLMHMTEKLLLILNLRDIGLGLKDLRSKTEIGQEPSNLIMAVVVEELRKKPEFYKIFATNTYEELVAIIEPFKNTGTIQYDFEYLLRPEVSEICRYLLAAVQHDAATKGAPPIPGA